MWYDQYSSFIIYHMDFHRSFLISVRFKHFIAALSRTLKSDCSDLTWYSYGCAFHSSIKSTHRNRPDNYKCNTFNAYKYVNLKYSIFIAPSFALNSNNYMYDCLVYISSSSYSLPLPFFLFPLHFFFFFLSSLLLSSLPSPFARPGFFWPHRSLLIMVIGRRGLCKGSRAGMT